MLLIDGHNLIGRAPDLSLAREEASREQLLRRIAAFKGSGGQRVVVVFDGNRPGAAKEAGFGGIRVVFAPAGRSADAEILRRVAHGNPRAHTVVTSDRPLAARAADLGARVESCESFLQRMDRRRGEAALQDDPVASAEDVEEWLQLFADQDGGGGHKM